MKSKSLRQQKETKRKEGITKVQRGQRTTPELQEKTNMKKKYISRK